MRKKIIYILTSIFLIVLLIFGISNREYIVKIYHNELQKESEFEYQYYKKTKAGKYITLVTFRDINGIEEISYLDENQKETIIECNGKTEVALDYPANNYSHQYFTKKSITGETKVEDLYLEIQAYDYPLYDNGTGDENWIVYRDYNTDADLSSNDYMYGDSRNGNYCAVNIYYKDPVDISGYTTINCLLDTTVYDLNYGISLSMSPGPLRDLSRYNPYQYSSTLQTSQNEYTLKLDITNVPDGSYYIGLNVVRSNIKIKAVWLE